MVLKQAMKDLDDGDGVYIRYCLDVSLFKLWWLQTHMKNLKQLIRDLSFADDAALVAQTERALQCITYYFTDAAPLFGQEVSFKKTEVLHQPAPEEEYRSPNTTIRVTELKVVHQFIYPGVYHYIKDQ